MKKSTWKTYAFWIVLVEAVGALSGWLARKGVKVYSATVEQPPLSPPSIVFPSFGEFCLPLWASGLHESIWLGRPMPGHAVCCCSLYSWHSISSGASSFSICKPLDSLSFG